MKLSIPKLALLIGLMVFFSPQAYAASTTLKAASTKTSVNPQQEFTIDLKLCTDDTVSTLDAFFTMEDSTAGFSAEIEGNNDVLQIITEKTYNGTTKIARIVGGNPGGITMDTDGCAILGTLTLIPTSTGTITISADFLQSQTLGGASLDPTETADLKKGTKLNITVSAETETAKHTAASATPVASEEAEDIAASVTPVVSEEAEDTAASTAPVVLEEIVPIIIPELHDAPIVIPQPVAYIVQEPQQAYEHADTGPEHIIIGVISFVLIGWVYLRKKLA